MLHKDTVAGAEMILQMVFGDNYWHGDLHPGNIIVQHLPQVPTTQSFPLLLSLLFFLSINL
jgi:hypothetical protein